MDSPNRELLKLLGASIRRERMACSTTQEKLAEKTELNLRTIQKIEAGKINILITTMIRIQKALNCPWKALLPEQ